LHRAVPHASSQELLQSVFFSSPFHSDVVVLHTRRLKQVTNHLHVFLELCQ